MTAEALLVAVAAGTLIALTAGWLAQPLWRGDEPAPAPDPRAITLLSEREAILALIRDLDGDLELERIAPDDHARRRFALVDRGAAVLSALDALQADAIGEASRRAEGIEMEVAARARPHVGPGQPIAPFARAEELSAPRVEP